MALVTVDLLGRRVDKVQQSIERIRMFEPPEGYYLAFSGGKDSVVIKAMADMAGVKYDAHYNVTTVDPPELVRFIRKEYPDVEFMRPELPMRKLIVKKQFPPTRLMRYCCEELKEARGDGRIVMTGTRWAESQRRKDNQGLVTIFNGKTGSKVAEEFGAEYIYTAKNGIVMNMDNDPARRTVEQCYRTNKTLVNPIIDWEDEDVWEFIHRENIPYCSLYDEGWTRLGCIGCPLGGYATMRKEFERWPAYRKLYIKAFEDMLAARRESGKETDLNWRDGEDVLRWWTNEAPKERQLDGQIGMFAEDDEG